MAAPGYRITLISPALDEYDVSDRVSVEDLGTVSEELEKDLLELVHGDYDVTLDNSDGFFDTLWNALTLAETWTIRVERERLGRRATWENIFAGVLNFRGPYGSTGTPGPSSCKRSPGRSCCPGRRPIPSSVR